MVAIGDWDPRGLVPDIRDKKSVTLTGPLLQTPRSRVPFDVSNTSLCINVGEVLGSSLRELEDYVREVVGPMCERWYGHSEYKSPLGVSKGPYDPYLRISRTAETDMFGHDGEPLGTFGKGEWVRTILRFRVSLTKTAYKLVPELVQLQLVRPPRSSGNDETLGGETLGGETLGSETCDVWMGD